ncbi:MAG TPA: ATP-binding protein [Candidatus Saccharimonadales bacterium]|nr:ATP-binding protein [Candidatus Saccharimonadales bacterium]
MQENKKPTAHLIIGFIGSGKTTFARKLEKEMGVVRFTKDEWMVKIFGNSPPKDKFEYDKFHEYDGKMTKLATEIALRFLKTGTSVIIDDGFWYRKQRDEMRQTLKDIGVVAKFYFLDTPVDVMKVRTVKRSESPPGDSFYITEQEFYDYLKMFQPPTEDEDFELIKYI